MYVCVFCRHPQDDSWKDIEGGPSWQEDHPGEPLPRCAAFYIAASCGDHRWRTSQR